MIPTRPSLVPIDEGEHLLVAKQIKVQERKISLYQYFGNKISGHMDKWKLVGVRRWECYHRRNIKVLTAMGPNYGMASNRDINCSKLAISNFLFQN